MRKVLKGSKGMSTNVFLTQIIAVSFDLNKVSIVEPIVLNYSQKFPTSH